MCVYYKVYAPNGLRKHLDEVLVNVLGQIKPEFCMLIEKESVNGSDNDEITKQNNKKGTERNFKNH